ncbi:hypothetical protein C1H46_008716 [Malus baccata]|uniref:Uncharacterized protein n=1 Tax=Malus baccata TaxID=106549 RepID=A0A540N3R6_MALBA|nr:hypothetical protein C1H46_008716 [Malus baccata]
MEDKNKDQSVTDADPNNLRQHFQFTHAIAVAMGNNFPTAEWCFWKDVPENVKKAVMEELLMKFQEWKFDVQRAIDRAQVDNAAINAPADDAEEE